MCDHICLNQEDEILRICRACVILISSVRSQADAEEAAGGESENGEKPLKRRKLKEGERGMSGLEDLNVLRTWLRQKVPADAVLATESLHYNPTGDVRMISFHSAFCAFDDAFST